MPSRSSRPPDRRARGRLEDEVLAALAARDSPMTSREVLTELGDGLAYTTVMTTLARLYEKGALVRERSGRSYAYALRPEADRAARSMSDALDHTPDRPLALSRFVDTLDPADLPVLRRLLDQQRRE